MRKRNKIDNSFYENKLISMAKNRNKSSSEAIVGSEIKNIVSLKR
jgi:hypothetical protein